MDQQQRARIRERNRRKRRKQVFYARIAALLIVAALLVGIFFAVRGVMALTGDKNSVTTFQEIENRLFRRKKKVYTKPEMTEEYLTVNPYSRPGEKLPTVKSVFVHYTANAGTSAMQNRSYFENLGITGETSASAHFIIGYEGEIVQCLPLEEIGYAVKGRNYDSVSIECCYLEEDGKFTDATYQSLLQLVSWLMGKYDLSIDDVLRQKGSMDIDTAKARHFQYFFGQDLPESRYHKQIRIILLQLCYRFRPFDPLRLQNRDLMLHGAYLDRRRHKLLTPALRSVRLCHHCQHFYTA